MTIRVIDFAKHTGKKGERRLADTPNCVVEGNPYHKSSIMFENPSGDFVSGIWTSTPGKWHAFPDKDEFCYIVSGHVRLIGEDGYAQDFKTGDSFMIPNGFKGFWNVIETTTKHFVILNY